MVNITILLNLSIVLQKMITVVQDNDLRRGILERIKQLSGELQKTKHGAKVLNKLQKQYAQIFNSLPGQPLPMVP